ncbi:hypothetical protein [Mucilaginibacter pocheonensis]|uniref:Uncharacterized protein n=1 Tax=Mucilaginibacter pocheonensis TaxID=398050 RepID=A0ABU1THI5_9SPHI|nr:hypothetical protein [Mucilaginibacter pocheonensis]MDR6944690.1 hypothetical protein [Mucilaginibacter pocheonensis]
MTNQNTDVGITDDDIKKAKEYKDTMDALKNSAVRSLRLRTIMPVVFRLQKFNRSELINRDKILNLFFVITFHFLYLPIKLAKPKQPYG